MFILSFTKVQLCSVQWSVVKVLLSFSAMFMSVLHSVVEVLFKFSVMFMSVLCSVICKFLYLVMFMSVLCSAMISFYAPSQICCSVFVFVNFSNGHICFFLCHVQFLQLVMPIIMCVAPTQDTSISAQNLTQFSFSYSPIFCSSFWSKNSSLQELDPS